MKRIPKDLADKMVMDVLVSISKLDDISSGFAKDSLDIMNNPTDNLVFTGVLLSKARPFLFNNNELDMRATILGAIYTNFVYYNKNKNLQFNNDLAKELSKNYLDKCANSTKLEFAVNQFVNAFYDYKRLEKKYPELMKIM